MPIVNCFIKEKALSPEKLKHIVNDWAELIGVNTEDICINVLTNFVQHGQQYEALAYLYLPSLWKEQAVEHIQKSLVEVLRRALNTTADQVMLLTSIIPSGHVVEKGKLVKW